MSLICPRCGATPGPMLFSGAPCSCGGVLEEVDEDILKALLPFAPATGRWGWLIDLVGREKVREIAALPPESRVSVLALLRHAAAVDLEAGQSAADFSCAEGEEFLR